MIGIMASRKILLGIVVMGLTIFLWHAFIYRRQSSKLQMVNQELTKVDRQISDWISETKGLSDYHKSLTVLEGRHRQLLARIPDMDELPELSQQIVALGKEHGCLVAYIRMPFSVLFPENLEPRPSGEGGLIVLPFQLVVRGNFRSLAGFLESMTELPCFSAFGELEMKRTAGDGNELETQLTMRINVKQEKARPKGLS